MKIDRRGFGKLSLAALPASAALLSQRKLLAAPAPAEPAQMDGPWPKPGSRFAGVWIGVNAPYSYLSEGHYDARSTLDDLLFDGLSGCEMSSLTPESYAGAPPYDGVDGQASPNGVGRIGGGGRRGPAGARRGGPPPAGARRGSGFGRRAMTPEQQAAQQAAMKKAQDALTQWRLSVPMSKFDGFRSMYNDAGVTMYAVKITLAMYMTDPEFDYAFNLTRRLGANILQMEYPDGAGGDELTDRIGQFASKHKIMVGYHAHTDATPTLWDKAMSQSPYNGINLDIGHYVAAGNHDILQFIQKNHARITTIHLKDRHYPEVDHAANEVFGQGDTPIVDILRLMRDQHYTFPASIEFEYPVPENSNANIEIARCVAYSKNALLTSAPAPAAG